MRTWLGSILFVVLATFTVVSGCGSKPEVVHDSDGPSVGGSSVGSGGSDNSSSANGGGIFIPEGGDPGTNGCPSTCEDLKANCGFVADPRCHTGIECGDCPTGQFCGGDGPSRCGFGVGSGGEGGACSGPDCAVCEPKTCADARLHLRSSWATAAAKSSTAVRPPVRSWAGRAAAADKPGQCGCKGACEEVPDCSNEPIKTTSVTGKVYDPAGNNPLYHVFVYIANNPDDPDLKAFPAGITCDVCGATAAGSPLLSEGDQAGTYTDVDGSFTLKNVPVGKGGHARDPARPLAARVHRSTSTRRVRPIRFADKTLLMPSKQSQGNIPLMAMVTGRVDSLECVLRKMGIDGTEFTNPTGTGRVQFYLGTGDSDTNGSYGQKIDNTTPKQSALFAINATTTQPVINNYDMTILACQGDELPAKAGDQNVATQLRRFRRSRVRDSLQLHLADQERCRTLPRPARPTIGAKSPSGTDDEGDKPASAVGHIDLVSNPKGAAFQGWLEAVNASTVGSGNISVNVVRHDSDSIFVGRRPNSAMAVPRRRELQDLLAQQTDLHLERDLRGQGVQPQHRLRLQRQRLHAKVCRTTRPRLARRTPSAR